MNYHKNGLKQLLEMILDGKVSRLVITHKDRLLRFGAELVFAICEAKQVEVVILNRGEDTSFEEDLAKDVLEIITVFSARLYGSRSHKNQKIIDGVMTTRRTGGLRRTIMSRKLEAAKAKVGLKPGQRIPKGVRIPLSNNALKAKTKLSKLHATIANIRKDALHKLTTDLVRRFALIGIKDLNVKGMMQNRKLSRSIADMSFFEFRRQLQYKADLYGSVVVAIDRWHPSSKTCSDCGYKLEKLPLKIREWVCPECGCVHDRDVNAAVNIEKYARMAAIGPAGSSPVAVCGETGSGLCLGTGETDLCEAEIQHQVGLDTFGYA